MLRSINLLACFFIFFILGSTHIEAQGTPLHSVYNFEIFELPGGQSANSVQAIVQDSFGFMWFGTQFGLYRWGGYNFKANVAGRITLPGAK